MERYEENSYALHAASSNVAKVANVKDADHRSSISVKCTRVAGAEL